MPNTEFNCLATIIGSMPHTDPSAACSVIARYLKDIPAWPQLPKRSSLENMYVQYSQGFPGVMVENDSIHIDRQQDNVPESMGQLYTAVEKNYIDRYPISSEYAEGLYAFLELENLSPRAVKGQIIGPFTWGLTVADEEGRAIIYDNQFHDMLAFFLGLKAGWQEKKLSRISKNTIIFVDEPYMASFGSVAVPFDKEIVIKLLNKTFFGIKGIKGIHCCGNTDWPILLETTTNIISFDTYNFAQSLTLYPIEINKFLHREGAIAWGIIPNETEALAGETVASLKDRLEEAIAPFTRDGIRFDEILKHSLLTPSCTLASLGDDEAAEQALELLTELSSTLRKRYL